jgi:hypothetical protein
LNITNLHSPGEKGKKLSPEQVVEAYRLVKREEYHIV